MDPHTWNERRRHAFEERIIEAIQKLQELKKGEIEAQQRVLWQLRGHAQTYFSHGDALTVAERSEILGLLGSLERIVHERCNWKAAPVTISETINYVARAGTVR